MLPASPLIVNLPSSPLLIWSLLAQGSDQRRPVSSELLRDDTLVVQQHNFSIVAPKIWRWTRQSVRVRDSDAYAFIASSRNNDSTLVVIAFDMTIWDLEKPSLADGLVKGMLEKLPPGWTVVDLNISQQPLPATSSAVRYRATLAGPADARLYQIGYILRGRPVYLISMVSLKSEEPSSLRQAVESFRVIDQRRAAFRLPAALPIGNPRTLLSGLMALFLVVEVLLRVRARKRSAIPSEMSLVSRTLILLGVTAALFLTSVEIPFAESSDPRAYALGAVTGVIAMAYGVAYFVYGRKAKRNLNNLARLFCVLCFLIPVLSAAGNARR